MYKGVTPTFTFTFPEGFHPADATKIIVTFSNNRQKILELTESDIDIVDDTIEVTLTQNQTLSFPDGPVRVQINFAYSDDSRVATQISTINWDRNLHSEVIDG